MSYDGIHQALFNRICSNLAELNRMLQRPDLNQELQSAEAIHSHESQEQYQRGQRSRIQLIEESVTICQGMIGELMATRQPMIKFVYLGQSQWISRADIIRAYSIPQHGFLLVLREIDESRASRTLHFKHDDPQVERIKAFLDTMAININAGNTQPLL